MPPALKLKGLRFGRWVVVAKRVKRDAHGSTRWPVLVRLRQYLYSTWFKPYKWEICFLWVLQPRNGKSSCYTSRAR